MQKPNIGRELLDVPMGDMIRDMAFAIADAQIKLDANSVKVAQMLGGIKEVTTSIISYDPTTKRLALSKQIGFEDCRVFFGKEKIKLLDAFDLYNTSSDVEFKVRILQNLGTMNYEYDCIETSNSDLTALKKDTKCTTEGVIYSVGIKDKKKFYRIESNKTYTEIQYYNVNIKRTANASSETVIYMPTKVSMLELGFSPTFYQFVDTIIEVKMSITYTQDEEYGWSTNTENTTNQTSNNTKSLGWLARPFGNSKTSTNTTSVRTSSVNAGYSQKFSYSAEGSSLLRTKLVPIPPPPILEERIRALMEVAKEEQASATPVPDNEKPANEDTASTDPTPNPGS